MNETWKITAGIYVKLNKSDSIYHCIRGFINTKQGETDPNDTFKLLFDSIYETVELSGRDNILHSQQLTNNGNQASRKEKHAQTYQMKEICFLLSD